MPLSNVRFSEYTVTESCLILSAVIFIFFTKCIVTNAW